ncbi:MAG: hypothetical protein J4N89_13755 [Chloroflexi bacterium]|nr:hypothetical protein [Chloroflexota bacterium]MCI0867601.1 hypothetical protein [Chloroflexota bacterium]
MPSAQFDIMALIIGAVLAVLSVIVVVYPFLQRKGRASRDSMEKVAGGPNPAPDLATEELDALLEAMRTLQLEHQLDKIPDDLYQRQMRSYRLRAAAALRRQVETRTGDPGLDLEREVWMVRLGISGEDGVGSDGLGPEITQDEELTAPPALEPQETEEP